MIVLRPMLLIFLAAGPWLASPAGAWATSADSIVAPPPTTSRDTVVLLPEVRVERARLADVRRRAPTAFVTEVRVGESGRALETLTELLAEVAGVHLQQYGGLGAFSTVSLRGSPAGHVAVFLDGAPLTSAAHGVVSLGDLPATAIERIEVYRGSSPLGLGLPAPGGAVHLTTRGAAAGRLGELRVTHGSFGTWEGRVTGAARRGAWDGLVHFGYQGSRGDFLYPDDNGTPFNAADDSSSTRINNRFEALALLAHLNWRPRRDLVVGLREDLFSKDQGVPGLGAVPARATRLGLVRSLTHLDLVVAERRWRPALRLRAVLQQERVRFRDPGAELGLGRHDTDDRGSGGGLDLELDSPRLLGVTLQAAGTLRREHARLSDQADGYDDPAPSRRDLAGSMLGLQLGPWGDRLVLHAAQRWDRLHDRLRSVATGGAARASEVTHRLAVPQLGASLGAPLGLTLRGNWTRGQRAPEFLELFGNLGSVRGNPDLRPEHAESWDAGGAWTAPTGGPLGIAIEAAHFESRARDLVIYVRTSQSSVRPENVGAARIRGEELSLRASGPAGLSLATALTRQDARDVSDVSYWRGKRLPQRPSYEAHARLGWRRGAFHAAAHLHAIGDNALDRYNRRLVPARMLVGASLSLAPFVHGPRLTIEGKNLGDDRISDVAGFPLPGRSLFASCEVRLGPPDSTP